MRWRLGERRELDGVVDDERRLLELGLDELRQQVVDELRPRALVEVRDLDAVAADLGHERVAVAVRQHVDAGLLEDRVAQRDAAPRRRQKSTSPS